MEILLEKNPHIKNNFKNNDGSTLLHDAVKSGSLEIVKLLIKAGLDINAQDVDSYNNIEQW